MISMSLWEAERRCGATCPIAALGAMEKKPGSDTWRIVHDDTRGVLVNRRVRKAHRMVLFREADQARHIDGHMDRQGVPLVWRNKVGTCGVASAAYWWGRLDGPIVWVRHYVVTM